MSSLKATHAAVLKTRINAMLSAGFRPLQRLSRIQFLRKRRKSQDGRIEVVLIFLRSTHACAVSRIIISRLPQNF